MKTLLKTLAKALAIVVLVVITVNLTEGYNAAVKDQEVKALKHVVRSLLQDKIDSIQFAQEKLTRNQVRELEEIVIEDTLEQLDKLPEYRDL